MKKCRTLLTLVLCAVMMTACTEQAVETETTEAGATAAAEATTAAGTATEETAAGTTDPDAINEAVAALDVTEPDSLGSVNSMGNYKGLAVTTSEHTVISAEEALEYINDSILPDYTEEVTDAIKEGDTANIDYEGKENGVAFDGGTAQGYDLEIGSGSFIDGFEDGLIGKKAGETVDLELTFPEDYQSEDLAGHTVIFTVKINSVTRPMELNEAFVKKFAADMGESFTTVEELKAYAQEQLQNANDVTEKQELYLAAVEKAVEAADITAAEEAITYTINSYVTNYASSMEASYGIDLGTMLSYYGMSLEDFIDYYEEYALESVKQRLLLQKVAQEEGLSVTEEDVKAFAESNGYDVDALKESVGEKLLNELVLEDLANKVLVDNAVITYEAETEEAEETTADGGNG